MKAASTAATAPLERDASWSLHPIELAILVFLAMLAHFVWREPWGNALWSACIAFTLLPRNELWDKNGNWRWNWLVLRWLSVTEILIVVFAAFWLHRSGDSLWLTLAQLAAVLLGARFGGAGGLCEHLSSARRARQQNYQLVLRFDYVSVFNFAIVDDGLARCRTVAPQLRRDSQLSPRFERRILRLSRGFGYGFIRLAAGFTVESRAQTVR